MKPQSLLEFIDAAHLTSFVHSEFSSRGGIMLVTPPNSFKSTIIETAFQVHPNSLVLSDLNVQQFARLRDDLAGGRYPSLAFTAFEKLYARHAASAGNLEGCLSALVEEGFTRLSFQDQRMASIKARALIVGGMTQSFYARKFSDWIDGGFIRRFLWIVYRISNPQKVEDAIHNWELLPIDSIQRKQPSGPIKYNLDEKDNELIRVLIHGQPEHSTGLILLKKIACVLKWKYSQSQRRDHYKTILQDIRPCLTRDGGTMDV